MKDDFNCLIFIGGISLRHSCSQSTTIKTCKKFYSGRYHNQVPIIIQSEMQHLDRTAGTEIPFNYNKHTSRRILKETTNSMLVWW